MCWLIFSFVFGIRPLRNHFTIQQSVMSLSFHLESRFISSLYSLIRYYLKIKWHCGWKIYMCTGFVQTGRVRKGMDSLTIISGNFPCIIAWWRHQMETFSAFLAICAGNSPTTGEIPAQKSVTRNFDVFVDLRLDERLSKQSWGWWLRRHGAHCGITIMRYQNLFRTYIARDINRQVH